MILAFRKRQDEIAQKALPWAILYAERHRAWTWVVIRPKHDIQEWEEIREILAMRLRHIRMMPAMKLRGRYQLIKNAMRDWHIQMHILATEMIDECSKRCGLRWYAKPTEKQNKT